MNPNIEQINKYLYGVSFSYIKMGWVKEFTINNEKTCLNTFIELTTDGCLLLDKDDPKLYKIMKQMIVEKVVPMSDIDLHETIIYREFQRNKPEHDFWAELYLLMLKAEQKRRIEIKTNGKAVKKWHLFKRQ